MKIKGISNEIVTALVERSNKLGQGRPVGLIGFIDKEGYIKNSGSIVDGGLSGLPFRLLLASVMSNVKGPLLHSINRLPENAVLISTAPGKTGIIISTGGINIFNMPIIKVGIKNRKPVGVGIIYPEKDLFKLASISEKVQLKTLAAVNMEEERKALREAAELRYKFIEISEELPIVEMPAGKNVKIENKNNNDLDLIKIESITSKFARNLVDKSLLVEQGREIAAIGVVNSQGIVEQAGDIVVGGMGYVPPRLLISGFYDISAISLREAYTCRIPKNAVIVHTHPGGTGVMHMGDAMAGPGTWGRSIIAIGHGKNGDIKGATVIEYNERLNNLSEEYEKVEQLFYEAGTPEEEADLRKKRYKIAQEYTDLCREILVK